MENCKRTKETVGDADNWIYLIERFQYGY
jgi:hypothetical protein